jgi:hypothetical protein
MHDPMTVAHEIKWPWKNKHGHRGSIFTIWHVDPETDGTDDSCGWFKRARHGDPKALEQIRKDFAFEFQYWFNDAGYPQFSVIAISIDMYTKAVWVVFKRNRRKVNRFMKKYLYEIIRFAENPTDSLHPSITSKYGIGKKEDKINDFASIIYGDILRKLTPWYKHPRWHIHHWKIQFRPWQNFRRRYFDKCCICGKRGFKGSAMGDWDGTKIWHQECDRSAPKPVQHG